MTNHTAHTERSGQSNAPEGTERAHTLIVSVEDRSGALDQVIGLFRRRRANMQRLALGPGELPNMVRVTVVVNDSEVGVDHLVEQLRKVVDVQHVVNVTDQQAVTRELALIKVKSTVASFNEIIELGHLFGAHAVDVALETVTLEVTGSEEKIEKFVCSLEEYGIREVARSGRVAIARDTDDGVVEKNSEE